MDRIFIPMCWTFLYEQLKNKAILTQPNGWEEFSANKFEKEERGEELLNLRQRIRRGCN
jgi:hypothetical protein